IKAQRFREASCRRASFARHIAETATPLTSLHRAAETKKRCIPLKKCAGSIGSSSALNAMAMKNPHTMSNLCQKISPDFIRALFVLCCQKFWTRKLQFVRFFLVTLLAALPAVAQNALTSDLQEQPTGFYSRPYLLGDWGGERTALAEKGINFDFFYITDMQ